MIIVADENIPALDAFFEDIGTIHRVSGRHLKSEQVKDADILLVRSVTKVNRELLEGSRVRFVGTTTIGTDHIDLDYLEQAGIRFVSAPGCNASSVVEYVLSVLSLAAESRGLKDWSDLSVGIVGAGNVGGELARRLDRLDFTIKVCDPPREAQEADSDIGFCSLEEALSCDVVTLHTPLTRQGDHPTWHLLDSQRIAALTADQLLINTSRGGVVDNAALKQRLLERNAPQVVLDVWEGEPNPDRDLMGLTWLATPHIAGYSLEGKVQGTEMVYTGLCQFLGLPARKKAGQYLPEPAMNKLAFTRQATEMDAISLALRACYDPRRDDMVMRRAMLNGENREGPVFDGLRKNYPVRREFSAVKIQLKGASKSLGDVFTTLGFKLKT